MVYKYCDGLLALDVDDGNLCVLWLRGVYSA